VYFKREAFEEVVDERQGSQSLDAQREHLRLPGRDLTFTHLATI
jgi:hypothetical protein